MTAVETREDFDQLVMGEESYPVLQVEIFEYCAKININGVPKYIALDKLIEVLEQNSGGGNMDSLPGALLPSKTFFFARLAGKIRLSCYYPGEVRPVNYNGIVRDSVVPNIIISHELQTYNDAWTVQSSKYFCTPKPVSAMPDKFINARDPSLGVFVLPFTNTYNDGRMCYGGNTMPSGFRGNNLRGLDWYFQYLFETPFNGDLGVSALRVRANPDDWYARLASLAANDQPFPYNELDGFNAE